MSYLKIIIFSLFISPLVGKAQMRFKSTETLIQYSKGDPWKDLGYGGTELVWDSEKKRLDIYSKESKFLYIEESRIDDSYFQKDSVLIYGMACLDQKKNPVDIGLVYDLKNKNSLITIKLHNGISYRLKLSKVD